MILPAARSSLRTLLAYLAVVATAPAAQAQMTLRLQDYATAPLTGALSGSNNSVYLARINFMAEDPANSNRFFVNDLNGPLYILDKTTKQFTQYLDFNGLSGAPGMFRRFVFNTGFANGLITFQFDPDYTNNGKFYTVHMESVSGTLLTPINAPFNTAGYTTTTSVDAPGSASRRTVLIEWTDTNRGNSTFEGSARELLRMDMLGSIHPLGDIIFNPAAQPGDADWRMMYLSVGDGSAGESDGDTRATPQMLSALGGKVLRIRPDNVGSNTPLTVSPNSRYYIPNDNPFTGIADSAVRDEIYALGFRNPHRMSWDVDPANPANNHLIVNDIGLHTWEEINIVNAGANYGYSAREGNQVLLTNDFTSPDPLPTPDQIPVYITDQPTANLVTPIYPVAAYGHALPGQTGPQGDSISSGYVYRGNNIPSLYGKYIFGDITTGQILWCDFNEMLAVDDGNAATQAAIHSIDLLWDNPDDAPNDGEELYTVITPGGAVLGPMHQIVEAGYEARGGTDPNLPGGAGVTAPYGRADIRLQIDAAGELYIMSKSDGMIRYITEAVGNANFNGDAQVDGDDFLIWQRNLGSLGGLAEGDADGDGRVTSADLGFWKQQFGTLPEANPVPEPTAAALAAFGLLALRRRRRA